MNVLIIHPICYHKGGAEIVIIELSKYLKKKNINCSILTSGMPLEVEKELIDFDVLVPRQILNAPISKVDEILRKYLHKHLDDYDIVNPHTPHSELYLYPYNKSSVWMCNEPPLSVLQNKRLSETEREAIDCIDKIVVSDPFNAERIKKFYDRKAYVNLYGIDHDFFKESKSKEETAIKYNINTDNFNLIHVGHIQQFKNQKESVIAVKDLKNKIPNIKLYLIGWDKFPYADTIREEIKKNNLEKYISITGNIPREDLRDIYYLSDLVLFPFKEQGGWLSFFECLVTKKPAIIGKNMLAKDIVKKYDIATITDNFSNTILEYYNNPSLFDDKVIRGYKWVKENISWNKFCENMLKCYKEVVRK